jgi:diacylglycerol kinase family enzyme
MNGTTTQTTKDREAELKQLEERTRIALAKAVVRATKEACTLRLTKKQREKVEKLVQRAKAEIHAMQKKAKP